MEIWVQKKRPKKPQTVTLSFRLTVTDRDEYVKKCHAAKMTVSAFFRDAVLNNKTKMIGLSPAQRRDEAKRNNETEHICRVVLKAGNNINQLAHRANSDFIHGIIDNSTYGAILNELEFISIALKGVLSDAD